MEEQAQNIKHNDGVIFIGDKPFMVYVNSTLMQINKGINKLIIKSRGKFISKAVDVVEVVKRVNNNMQISDVSITSSEFENKEKKMIRVSSIEIVLSKK